ncbi:Ig-like domain-containing protein [Candidatus Daviesbacteria bacterium]|nr:Ig-like domain-containing protein [Candidatus Daviesbacteria bacterium]
MINLSLKQKIIVAVLALGVILIVIFQGGLSNKTNLEKSPIKNDQTQITNENPRLISTNPDPLNNAVILPTQTIELTFNQPIENRGELKFDIVPKIEVNVELSSDKKTARIIPIKPYGLGQRYEIFIKTDTKFDGGKKLESQLQFGFNTIVYRGV